MSPAKKSSRAKARARSAADDPFLARVNRVAGGREVSAQKQGAASKPPPTSGSAKAGKSGKPKAAQPGAARRRRAAKSTTPPGPLLAMPLGRRPILRALAYLVGLLVFLAHVYTLETPGAIRNLFAADIRDMLYHGGMLLTFAVAYRLSINAGARHVRLLGGADAATLLVCSGWGAACECVQLLIPARNFSLLELALNMGAPLLVVAVVRLSALLRRTSY